jgi:peptidoglycan/xylan/chitin deacetylase (PgdA/CDA1 family)
MMLKTLAGVLSPGATHGRLATLIFHRVLSQPDPIFPGEPDIRRFDEILGWVKRWFDVLPLDEAVSLLAQNRLPARALTITFDDGYADNAENALLVLQKHGMPATFFVATSFLDGGRMWNDTVIEAIRHCTRPRLALGELGLGDYPILTADQKREAIETILRQIKYEAPAERLEKVGAIARIAGSRLSDTLMMRSGQVKALRQGGMQIGAHTLTHPILARISDEEARDEMQGSKTFLENLLGEEVPLFAYPNGKPDQDYLARHARIARELGFKAAVSTAPGVATPQADLFQLPRFTPWDKTPARFGLRMLMNSRVIRPQISRAPAAA